MMTIIGARKNSVTLSADDLALLVEARKRRGITHKELARRVGMSKTWFMSCESGRHQPSLGVLELWTAALGLLVDIRVKEPA